MKHSIHFLIFGIIALVPHARAELPPDSSNVDSTQLLGDELRGAAPLIDSLQRSQPMEVNLTEDYLSDLDHEEFGDWMAVMPGFYPLDPAAFGAPYRGLILGVDPSAAQLLFRGRLMEDHLIGGADLGWIPPEALTRVRYQPFTIAAPGGRMEAVLRSLEPSPPSSRIAVRDGYYGLGTVDFDLVQKIAPEVVLNGGGRVATYGGRVPNSEGYGLNLRSEIAFRLNPEISGWGGLMQGKQNSQVPNTNVNYNRDRYEADLTLRYRAFGTNLYGIQQRETYGGEGSTGWDEIGGIAEWQPEFASIQTNAQLKLSAARWRLKGLSWASTALGGAQMEIKWQPVQGFSGTAILGLDISDDFSPARHVGLASRATIIGPLESFVAASQHQIHPTRFEWAADFESGEHYLPYDPALLQNPGLPVLGEKSLKNETYSVAMSGLEINNVKIHGALGLFWRRVADPIGWQIEGDAVRAFNGEEDEAAGALGWLICRPIDQFDLGATGSFLPHDSNEESLFPETIAHAWAQFRQKLFKNELELRFRLGGDYWGARQAPVPSGWEDWGDVLVVNGRISAYLLGAHLFWGINNIFSQDYMLYPGRMMMHKEEVWGVSWNFRD